MQHMVINNYHIQSELGRGGMAVVYQAEHQLLQNKVAIKVLNKEYVHNSNIRMRFLAEARNMARMSHPNIIRVTDLIDEGDTVAFVMEYIDGETLKEYLERKGKLKDEEIKIIFTQMLEAVGYVHEQNLVHRDIKPSNFIITPQARVKLLDFGIAKNTDASNAEYTQTGTGVQMGTLMYMSPEQITETKSVTAQSDIYSLGVILWQMVSGRKPYDTQTLSNYKLQNKIVNDPLDNKNTKWDPIIQKATAKEITQRYNSAAAFKTRVHSNSLKGSRKTEETVIEKDTKRQTKPSRGSNQKQETKPVSSTTAPKNNSPAKLLLYLLAAVGVIFFVKIYISSDKPKDAVIVAEESPLKGELAIDWVNIPGGNFTMGSPLVEAERADDELLHDVTLDGFKMSKYEITFDQYDAFCDATGRSKPADEGWGRGKRPVINVTWNDAKAFADWAGAKLPTESQWEYACRAGTSTPFNIGSCLATDAANYDGNYPYQVCSSGTYYEKTKPVGTYSPNSWGLYDMHGNVGEWCSDWYGNYPFSLQTNPQGPLTGSERVNRGGSWFNLAQECRSAYRNNYLTVSRFNYLGFRLVSPQ